MAFEKVRNGFVELAPGYRQLYWEYQDPIFSLHSFGGAH